MHRALHIYLSIMFIQLKYRKWKEKEEKNMKEE